MQDLPGAEDLLNHPLIKLFDEQIEEMQESLPGRTIIPPFFWDRSGRATIHGFITTSFKLIGDTVFILLFENPEFVEAVHKRIEEWYRILILHFSEKTKLPITGIHIGECSGGIQQIH